jgi:hypothetical protein
MGPLAEVDKAGPHYLRRGGHLDPIFHCGAWLTLLAHQVPSAGISRIIVLQISLLAKRLPFPFSSPVRSFVVQYPLHFWMKESTMRKPALFTFMVVLVLVLVAGCGGEAASPTPSPTPTPAPETATAVPPTSVSPSGPAVCVDEPLDFPVVSDIPPVTGEDHVHGPADAPITLIEYADFQ